MSQYIYLIKPREFVRINEKVYKIGKSKQARLSRIKSYPKGTELILQIQFPNCGTAERHLIKQFRTLFKEYRDSDGEKLGNEYFVGDVKEMSKAVLEYHSLIVHKNETLNDVVKDAKETNIAILRQKAIDELHECICIDDEVETENENEDENEIIEQFPNYKQDVAYGGKKRLICLESIYRNTSFHIHFIHSDTLDPEIICRTLYTISIDLDFDPDKQLYNCYKKMFTKKVIEMNKILNLNKTLINAIIKCKSKINVLALENNTYTDIRLKENSDHMIKLLFGSNCVVNDKWSGIYHKWNGIEYVHIYTNKEDIHGSMYNVVILARINKKRYSKDYLRKYLPYCVEINKTNNSFYMLNRDYEYIGMDTKSPPFQDYKNYNRIYLYKDGTQPFDNDNYKIYISKYNKITRELSCINPNPNTVKALKII